MEIGIAKIIMSFFSMIMSLFTVISSSLNPAIEPFKPIDIDDSKPEVECMEIIANGQSDYVIVCAKSQGDSEYTAAVTLQKYLKQISGVTLPIVSDSTASSEYEIIVGKTNREGTEYTVDRASFGDEDVNVFTVGQKLVIAGAERRGTLYGVYRFLEEVLDCHWYSVDTIVIPEAAVVKVPTELSIQEKSNFEYRETDWISPKNPEYSIANQLNANTYRYLSEENGGVIGYTGPFCHSLATSFCAASKYFDSHPEYFALHGGKRVADQLCLTNPDVLAIVIDEVKATLKNNPNAYLISLTQNDNQKYCQCENCAAVDKHEGAHSGTMINFVNAVADAIKDDYPNARIDTFAYQYTRKAPLYVRPRSNVVVRLCSIECCFAHAINDPDCDQNVEFCQDLSDWAKICDKLYVWDYTTNYSNYNGPFPNFGVMQKNMQFFSENHVVGIYEEGNYTASECNGEFAELRAYLLSRLMWDPYCDYYKEMRNFCRAYYGEGWQYVYEYIRMTTEKTGTNGKHMGIYASMDDKGVLNLTDNEIEYCNDLWAKAKELAENETVLKHVELSELSWRYWKSHNRVSEFKGSDNRTAQNKILYEDFKRLGIKRIHEGGGGLLTDNPDFSKNPRYWNEG